MVGEEKQQKGKGEKTIVVLGIEEHRWAEYLGANHLQTTLLPCSPCRSLVSLLVQGCPPGSLVLVCQHFLLEAAWLRAPQNPPIGSRLSCLAWAILTPSLLGAISRFSMAYLGHLLASLGKFCGPQVMPGFSVHDPELVLITHSLTHSSVQQMHARLYVRCHG